MSTRIYRKVTAVVLAVLCAASRCLAGAVQPANVWTPLGLAGGGAMYSISASPLDRNLMMLSCDMSGAYISRDGGRDWELIHHSMLRGNTSCSALFDPARAGTIYAVEGYAGYLKISNDSGRTWRLAPGKAPWSGRLSLLYKDGIRFFAGGEDGMWLSADGFATWSACSGIEGRIIGMCTDRRSLNVYVAGTDKGIFKSDDGGKSFRRIAQSLPSRPITGFAGGSDGKKTMLYTAVECRAEGGKLTGGIYASDDGGKIWSAVMNQDLNVEIKKSSKWANSDIAQYRFLLTTDRLPTRIYAYCPGTSYAPPDHNTIYRSDDSGKKWKAVFFSDPRFKGQYNMDDDRVTLAIGQRYQSVPYSVAVNPADPDALMMTTDMFVYTTKDGGKTWQVSQSAMTFQHGRNKAWACNGLVVTTVWNYYIDPFDPRRHYICYTDIGFARSMDAGRTWVWEGYRLPWHNTTYELAFDPAVKGRIWGAFSDTHDIPNGNIISGRHGITMKGGVAMSDDHGETWMKMELPEGPCVSVILDPASPKENRTLYASMFEKGVYKSTNNGRSWVLRDKGLGSVLNKRVCRLMLHGDGTLFCLVTAKKMEDGRYDESGPGIYRSTDKAETWEKINSSRPLLWPKDFALDPANSRCVLVGATDLRGKNESGLYGTSDGGRNWDLLAKKGSEHFGATYHPTKKGWIYMTMCEDATESGLYLSRDNGKNWEPFTKLPFSNIMRVHFDPDDPQNIILSTFGASVLHGPAVP
ncbi:MAG: hypothetical protein WCN95_09410 [bacterium]